MVAPALKYESNWSEKYIFVNHLSRPFICEILRNFIFSRPNDDSWKLWRTTLNTAFISSHVCLKKPCLRFLNVSPFYFYNQIYSGMRNYCHRQRKIGHNFDMKRRIKIRRHGFVGNPPDSNLAKFQTNWSRGCRLGVQKACTTRIIYISRNKDKLNFDRNEISGTQKCW